MTYTIEQLKETIERHSNWDGHALTKGDSYVVVGLAEQLIKTMEALEVATTALEKTEYREIGEGMQVKSPESMFTTKALAEIERLTNE